MRTGDFFFRLFRSELNFLVERRGETVESLEWLVWGLNK
jgi:hypothetical protein